MLCVKCQHIFTDNLRQCPICNHPVPTSWKLLKTVYPPEDNVIKGLLESCGIPVILRSREGIGRVQGLSFGPLAEIRIIVPSNMLPEASKLLLSVDEPQTTPKEND